MWLIVSPLVANSPKGTARDSALRPPPSLCVYLCLFFFLPCASLRCVFMSNMPMRMQGCKGEARGRLPRLLSIDLALPLDNVGTTLMPICLAWQPHSLPPKIALPPAAPRGSGERGKKLRYCMEGMEGVRHQNRALTRQTCFWSPQLASWTSW